MKQALTVVKQAIARSAGVASDALAEAETELAAAEHELGEMQAAIAQHQAEAQCLATDWLHAVAQDIAEQFDRQRREALRLVERDTARIPQLEARLVAAKAEKHRHLLQRHRSAIAECVPQLIASVAAAAEVQSQALKLREAAVRDLGEGVVAATLPHVAYGGVLLEHFAQAWASELKRAYDTPSAPRPPAGRTAAKAVGHAKPAIAAPPAHPGRSARRASIRSRRATIKAFSRFCAAASSSPTVASRLLTTSARCRLEAHLNEGLTNASSRAGKAIAALGIDHKELEAATTDTGKLLELLREKFSQYRDGPDKVRLAHDLLGRQVQALLPILNMTAAEFEAYDQRVKATGADMSGPMLAAAAETGKNFNFLELAVEGLARTLYWAFEPAIDLVVTGLSVFAEGITQNIRGGGNLATVLAVLVGALDTTLATLTTVVYGVMQLWQVFAGLVQTITVGAATIVNALASLAAAANHVAKGEFSQILPSLEKPWSEAAAALEQIWNDAAHNMRAEGQSFVATITNLFSNLRLSLDKADRRFRHRAACRAGPSAGGAADPRNRARRRARPRAGGEGHLGRRQGCQAGGAGAAQDRREGRRRDPRARHQADRGDLCRRQDLP